MILYTYNYQCRCNSQMHIEISKELYFDPSCLHCGQHMAERYSIGPNGELHIDQEIAD